MQRAFSHTARWIVALATLAWGDLALGQPGSSRTAVQTQELVNVRTAAGQAAEDRILWILETPFSDEARNTSLSQVLARIARSANLPIHIDEKALEEASVGLDSPVNVELPPVSLRSALDMVLGRLDLAWTIKDECLLVTTPEIASNLLITKVYPVEDLVGASNAANRQAADYRLLIQTITDTIAPTSWDEVGGPGAITTFYPSGSLVVLQTRQVHEELETLLAALRTARDTPFVARGGRHVRQHTARRHYKADQFTPAEPARYAVAPTAAWSLPQVHE